MEIWLFLTQLFAFFCFPKFTLSFGCNRQQPIPWFGDFHSIQCPISVSCLARSLQAFTNFFYIQFLSTYMYLHCYDHHYSLVWDYDDRFLRRDFPFSCLVLYVVLSRCCIYFGVKNRIFCKGLKKRSSNSVLFFSKETDSSSDWK